VPFLRGRLMSSSLRALRGEGLVRLIGAVVCLSYCAAGPLVRHRGQWMTAYRAAVQLAHANQPPLKSDAVHESSHVSKARAYSKYPDLYLLPLWIRASIRPIHTPFGCSDCCQSYVNGVKCLKHVCIWLRHRSSVESIRYDSRALLLKREITEVISPIDKHLKIQQTDQSVIL